MTETDLISRQAAIDAIHEDILLKPHNDSWFRENHEFVTVGYVERTLLAVPSAQPEQLTDKEQMIFLAAMGREEKVCKEVDDRNCREPYEDSLVRICHEITRKVKGALWNGK